MLFSYRVTIVITTIIWMFMVVFVEVYSIFDILMFRLLWCSRLISLDPRLFVGPRTPDLLTRTPLPVWSFESG